MGQARDRKPAIVLTGFGPFPGIAANASCDLVEAVARAAARRFPKKRIISHILPTEWVTAPEQLAALYKTHTPILMLHFGVSERAAGLQIESQAHNVRSPFHDAAGKLPEHPHIASRGNAVLSATIPVNRIAGRLARMRVRASVSHNAGTYLCNAVLYRSLQWAGRQNSQAGFIHIPADFAVARFDFDTAILGGLEIIRVCLGRPEAANASPAGKAAKGPAKKR